LSIKNYKDFDNHIEVINIKKEKIKIMNLQETGRIIEKARKDAGYTQIQIAKMLNITDKAVSKWERGICLPDATLLTKLSMILDVDIEYLVSGTSPYGKEKWHGEIRANTINKNIAGKPLIYYLLSYFLLVGITDIALIIPKKDIEYVNSLELEQFGLTISFEPQKYDNCMVVEEPFFLFGVNLTRQLQYCLNSEDNISLYLHGKRLPISFFHSNNQNNKIKRLEIIKPLGRGYIFIPLKTTEDIEDAGKFIFVYEKHCGKKISDLKEITVLRNLL